LEIQRLFSLE
ncbi:hypothetical protein BVZ65_00057B, partial [Haemophilus influenzae]